MNSINLVKSNLYSEPLIKPLNRYSPLERSIQVIFSHCMTCLKKTYNLIETLLIQMKNKVFSLHQNLDLFHRTQHILTQKASPNEAASCIEPVTPKQKEIRTSPLLSAAYTNLKNFGIGAGSIGGLHLLLKAGGIDLFTMNRNFLGSAAGMLDETKDLMDPIANLVDPARRLMSYFFKDIEPLSIDIDLIMKTTSCPFEKLTKTLNARRAFISLPEKTVFDFKLTLIQDVVISAPIIEELLFRGFCQELLLKQVPKFVLKKIAPGKETLLDTRIAQIFRIGITAALFSAVHSLNRGTLPDSYVDGQIIGSAIGGIYLGILSERFGLSAAIGAHMTQNLFGSLPILMSC